MYGFFTPTYYSNQGLNIAVGLYVSMCIRVICNTCVRGVFGKKKVENVSFAAVVS